MPLDVDDSIAATMGLLWWLLTVVTGAIGGLVFVFSGASLPPLRSRAPERVRGAA